MRRPAANECNKPRLRGRRQNRIIRIDTEHLTDRQGKPARARPPTKPYPFRSIFTRARLITNMPKRFELARTLLSLALLLYGGGACNLLRPTDLETPAPTPAIPQVKILFPAHNQQVVEGAVFDIEIHAFDPAAGIQRVELYVDEELQQTSESESGSARDYRVTMNWYAKELGWHKFAAIAYRADGLASHPQIIALEVVPPG